MDTDFIKAHFTSMYPASDLARWFDPLVLCFEQSTGCCTIVFPHKFFADWFFQTSSTKLHKGLSTLPPVKSVQFALGSADNIVHEKKPVTAKPATHIIPPDNHRIVNAEQQFDNFITNKKNFFQVQAAQTAIQKYPDIRYNPIVIIGPSGTGKTHLLNAMANSLEKKNILFFHGKAQQLANHSIDAFSVLTSKIFFIDDVQAIKDNKEHQRKFLYFFDQAKAQQLLIVVCIDAHPAAYNGLSNKIRMRLTDGLLLELKKPDVSIRLKYVLEQAEQKGLALTKEGALSLAQRHADFRSINGALMTLKAYKNITNKNTPDAPGSPDAPDVPNVLGGGTVQKMLSPKDIIKQTAKYYNVSPVDISGKKREKEISYARQVAIFLCRELTGCTLAQIGEFFGGRDHSSIVYTVKKIQSLQQSNQDTNNQITQLKKLCLTAPWE